MRNQERPFPEDLDLLNIHDLWGLQSDLNNNIEAVNNRLMDLEEPRDEAEKKEKARWETRKQELQARLSLVSEKIEKRSL